MARWPRWRFGTRGEREAALEERVTTLQSSLVACKAAATRLTNLRPRAAVAITAVILGLGFALGVYSEPLKQAVTALGVTLGFTRPTPNAAAANAAYQKGDYASAMQIALPLAHGGDARAQLLLGHAYYRGRGVPLDYAEAAKWYRLAADEGEPEAQFNLGHCYLNGHGVPQDNVNAYMWYNLAAARFPPSDTRNRDLAAKSRDALASKMTPDEIVEAQKLGLEWNPKSRR